MKAPDQTIDSTSLTLSLTNVWVSNAIKYTPNKNNLGTVWNAGKVKVTNRGGKDKFYPSADLLTLFSIPYSTLYARLPSFVSHKENIGQNPNSWNMVV